MRTKRLVLTTVLLVNTTVPGATPEAQQPPKSGKFTGKGKGSASRALTSGPVAPGSSLALRETTLATSQLLAKRWPPRLYGRASGDCHDDNQTIRQGRKS